MLTEVERPAVRSPFLVAEPLVRNSSAQECILKALHVKNGLNPGDIANLNIENVTGGNGTISVIYKCTVTLRTSDEPVELILKVSDPQKVLPAFDQEDTEPEKKTIVKFHNLECEFYESYGDDLNFPVPKVYGMLKCNGLETPGIIVMESFMNKAAMVDLATGLNPDQLFNITKHLAAFHKHCKSHGEWKDKHYSAIEAYRRILDVDFVGVNLEKLRVMRPGVFDKGIDAFLPYGRSRQFMDYVVSNGYKELGLPAVLVHGDFWTNNILFKTLEDGSISDEIAAVIDWQMFHEGSLVRDITRVMVMCVDGHTRRKHQKEVLQCYYSTLTEMLEREGREIGFSVEQVMKAYRVTFVYQAILLLCMGPYLRSFDQGGKGDTTEKLLLRAEIAMNEALEMLPEFPLDLY